MSYSYVGGVTKSKNFNMVPNSRTKFSNIKHDRRHNSTLPKIIGAAWCTTVAAQGRRQGFVKAGIQLLCEHAKNEKIPELYDNIAIDNTGIHLFLQCGFQELIASSREKQQRVASKKSRGSRYHTRPPRLHLLIRPWRILRRPPMGCSCCL